MEYYINSDTLLLISLDENNTKVYEKYDTLTIQKNIMKIIDDNCKYFGSTYEGRIHGARALLNMKYKLPIILSEEKEIIYFPTCSVRQTNCCWVSLQNIENYKSNNGKTIITFKNNVVVELDISYGSFENQIFRATLLLMILKKHKKK